MVTISEIRETANAKSYIRECVNAMKLDDAIRALSTNIPASKRDSFVLEMGMVSTDTGKVCLCLEWLSEVIL